jgi:hypothetical protein
MISEGSDSEEDLLQQAFPVDEDEDFDPSVPPSNGEEFLRLVRYVGWVLTFVETNGSF